MDHMSREALATLAVVWLVILANTGYCFYRLMTSERHLDGSR
jgi:hypothetical protein